MMVADDLRVDRVEAGERLVEYHEFWPMDHRGDERELLGHTLGELFDLLVPPAFYSEADEPLLEGLLGLRGAHSLELRQIHSLLTHLHLTIKASFLRHIANPFHI